MPSSLNGDEGKYTPDPLPPLIVWRVLACWNATPTKAPNLHAHWRSHRFPPPNGVEQHGTIGGVDLSQPSTSQGTRQQGKE